MELKKGKIFYDQDGYKCHVVAILDEENHPQIVYKYYGNHKQWWHYFVISVFRFEYSFRIGLFSKDYK